MISPVFQPKISERRSPALERIAPTQENKPLPSQHILSNPSPTAGIQVPLHLPGLQIVTQWQQTDGTLTVVVEAACPTARCVYCQQACHRVHDRRFRRKRDLALRTYPVELLLVKRRFRCPTCQKTFTETDTACGWRKRTTARLRAKIGQLACQLFYS